MKKSCDFKVVKDNRGQLFSFDKIGPLLLKRAYFIECKGGMRRGSHFHKIGKQLICLVEGELNVKTFTEKTCEEFVMRQGEIFFQDTFCTFEFESRVEISKLLVLCDNEHDPNDYYTGEV